MNFYSPNNGSCFGFFGTACNKIMVSLIAGLVCSAALLGGVAPANAQVLDTSTDRLRSTNNAIGQKQKHPYEITSRIHLQKGSSMGYLVVQVKLNKGYHIYSLTQPGAIPPSKLTVAPSNGFRQIAKFNPDRPAAVIAKDPVFGQRVEKHSGTVEFFAPIELSDSVDPNKLIASVQFDGQVCTADSCLPIRKLKLAAKFAGYYDVNNKQNGASSSVARQSTGGQSSTRRQ